MNLKRAWIAAALILSATALPRFGAGADKFPLFSETHLDLDDLDVRDINNKPVHDQVSKATLTALFRESLHKLIAEAPVRSLGIALAQLTQLSDLFHKGFLSCRGFFFKPSEQALVQLRKGVVHNVHKLWITFSDGQTTYFGVLSHLSLERKPQKLYLRC